MTMTNNEMNNEMSTNVTNDLDKEIMPHIVKDTEDKNDKVIRRLIRENKKLHAKINARDKQRNNERLWEESHKPVSRFVIDDKDGYVTVREVIDSANGEVELNSEKFSYSDLKSLAVDKTVEWKNKKNRKDTTNTVTAFAASFVYSFLMSYGISLLIKGMCKKK